MYSKRKAVIFRRNHPGSSGYSSVITFHYNQITIFKWWQSASLSYSSQFPVPSSGIQNTSQFDSRNLAHLQNKLLLSLAHYHPTKSAQEQNAQSEMLYLHQLVSTICTRMFLFRFLFLVH